MKFFNTNTNYCKLCNGVILEQFSICNSCKIKTEQEEKKKQQKVSKLEYENSKVEWDNFFNATDDIPEVMKIEILNVFRIIKKIEEILIDDIDDVNYLFENTKVSLQKIYNYYGNDHITCLKLNEECVITVKLFINKILATNSNNIRRFLNNGVDSLTVEYDKDLIELDFILNNNKHEEPINTSELLDKIIILLTEINGLNIFEEIREKLNIENEINILRNNR